jgi:hypothetical protein
VGHDQKRMTGILLATSSEPAASQWPGRRQTSRKNIARAEVIEHFDLITGWIFAGKKKKELALKPANYP